MNVIDQIAQDVLSVSIVEEMHKGRCNMIGFLSFGEFNFLLFLFSRRVL